MNRTIDFTKLKRIPIPSDIEEAQNRLEDILPNIIEKHGDFFTKNNYPKRIDYIINHTTSSKSGLIQVPYPEVLFMDAWLTEEIRLETAITFYDLLFKAINEN